MKKYENPMLTLISIKHNDIVTGSQDALGVNNAVYEGTPLAPGRFDLWYEGE